MKPLPSAFLSRLQEIYPEYYNNILEAFATERVWSFRVNTLKSSLDEVKKEFNENGILFEQFHNFENIFTFDRKFEYAIKGSKAFYDGKIYLQSIASMIPVLILAPKSHEKILDVCAAPGSKTTQIAMIQENNWQVVALEKNQIRADKLAYNCRLQNAQNIEIIKTDALKYLDSTEEFFDKILLDVPCSAEGRIDSRNEKSFWFWSEENIRAKSQLQTELLQKSWKKLKKWWTLVYSTCTLAPEENEEVIAKFCNNNTDAKIQWIEMSSQSGYFIKNNISNFRNRDFSVLEGKWIRIPPTKWTEWFFLVKIAKK